MQGLAVDDNLACLDQVPLGMALVRGDLAVVLWNRRMEELTGVPGAQAAGSPLGQHLPAFCRPSLQETLCRVLAEGRPALLSTDAHGELLPLRRGEARDGAHYLIASPFDAGGTTGALLLLTAIVPPEAGAAAEDGAPPAGASCCQDIDARIEELGIAGDPGTESEVLGEFVSTLNDLRGQLQEAVAQADCAAAMRLAHRLAGCALTMGAARLGALAARFEREADARRTGGLHALLGALGAEAEQVIAHCERRRSKARA
ncbi:MAG: Hpt domain-containing protein [Planctomycetes bacterium]|nr:Hpt domain-containing protein [Planctomycetota bacterium]